MEHIRYFCVIAFAICVTGCIGVKDVSKSRAKESFKFKDNSIITESTKEDYIILPAPKTPNARPRDTTITYRGQKGLVSVTSYDEDGFLSGQIISSPATDKVEHRDIEAEYKLKTLELERKLNIETIDAIGKWGAIILIPVGFFFAVAFWLRGK